MGSGVFYGHIKGAGHGSRKNLTAAQYYNQKGGHFVKADDAGPNVVSLITYDGADVTSRIVGWADVGKGESFSSPFVSVATSDALVMSGIDDVFRVPAANSVSNTDMGKLYNLTSTGSTTGFIQQINNTGADTTSTDSCVLVTGVDDEDLVNQTLQVKMVR